MIVGISSDHGGFKLKEQLVSYLQDLGYRMHDYGTFTEESVDYPKYAFRVSEAIANKQADRGIVICKTGIGVSIAANKVKGIRCAKVTNLDEARLCKEHNDANVIALSANTENALEIARIFLETEFSNEERHLRRVNMIKTYEETNEY